MRNHSTSDDDSRFASLAATLLADGYLHLLPETLGAHYADDLDVFDRAFRTSQDRDPAPGHRWRSYSAFQLLNDVVYPVEEPYVQDAHYNPDAAGQKRTFRPVEAGVLESATLRGLRRFHAKLGQAAMPGLFAEPLKMGVHMVSYRPVGGAISVSSPAWLHQDQEPYVVVILAGLSKNLGGGENLISGRKQVASHENELVSMVNMQEPLEMLVLTKRHFHAVMPMYSKNGRQAFRNIVILTFAPLYQAQVSSAA